MLSSRTLSTLGPLAGVALSSTAPHIPQKRKLSALSSPHFGQITVVPLDVVLIRVYLVARHSVPAPLHSSENFSSRRKYKVQPRIGPFHIRIPLAVREADAEIQSH
jgi:hypothetical protein